MYTLIINAWLIGILVFTNFITIRTIIYLRKNIEDKDNINSIISNLEEIAYTDALTGVNNRRYFNELARDYFLISVKNGKNFAILILDIDDFKKINDTYGHLIGDEVLKSLSRRVQEVIGNKNFFYRLGGEEFVVIFPNYLQEEALIISDNIRNNIINTPFSIPSPLGYNVEIKVTVSFGLASVETDNTLTFDQLLSNADKALYYVKSNGKNAIQIYSNFIN